MPSAPLVSAVMPVYNRERYLSEAIESWLGQEYRPLELVIVDDGSTDGTAEIARRYGPPVRYEYQPHGGIANARNRTLDLAHGEYLAFLDSDDVWGEGQLAPQMDLLQHHPDLDRLFGQVTEFISPDLDPETAGKIVCHPEPRPSMGVGAIIRADAFRRVGRFRTAWRVGEFMDWHLRANELGLTRMTIPEIVARRRLHAGNHAAVRHGSALDYVRILKASLDRRRNPGDP